MENTFLSSEIMRPPQTPTENLGFKLGIMAVTVRQGVRAMPGNIVLWQVLQLQALATGGEEGIRKKAAKTKNKAAVV